MRVVSVRRSPLPSLLFTPHQPTSISWARRLFLAISIRRCVNGWPASVSPSSPLPSSAVSRLLLLRLAGRLPPAAGPAGRHQPQSVAGGLAARLSGALARPCGRWSKRYANRRQSNGLVCFSTTTAWVRPRWHELKTDSPTAIRFGNIMHRQAPRGWAGFFDSTGQSHSQTSWRTWQRKRVSAYELSHPFAIHMHSLFLISILLELNF